MTRKILMTFVLAASLLLINHSLRAQEQNLRPSSDSWLTVTGTSTLHDWEMKSERVTGEAIFLKDDNGNPLSLESLMFRLGKTSLKSDKSALDRRAYQALNSNRHPEIVFRSNGSNNLKKQGESYIVNTRGDLSISGVTRQISIDATCINGEGNRLVCSGSKKLKMSDFNVEPPVLMLGTLRTGDEVTISYQIIYQ